MKLIAYFLLALPLCAATRYVATTGSNSSGNGTEASPWATISYATANATDGDLILLKEGTYNGEQNLRGQWTNGITVRSEVPYQARLRHSSTVIKCFSGQKITFEGFDIAHSGPGAGALVMQVQSSARDIVIRNNIFHDSYNNDLLKINNGTRRISVIGNMFYNQEGTDEHIDINSVDDVVVQDNVFFNDFAGSGRENLGTSSFIVVKDSNGDSDGIMGSSNVRLQRNVMFNYIGRSATNFILFGEDGKSYYESFDCLAENNLLLGNYSDRMRSAFGVRGSRDITFRNNTVSGDLPSFAFAIRLYQSTPTVKPKNIKFYNNIWSDPTGTMEDFSDTSPDQIDSYTLENNLYWNDGNNIPVQSGELVNFDDDPTRIVGDPKLDTQSSPILLPRWNPSANRFADGSSTIREVFERIVVRYGKLGEGSVAIDAADASNSPEDDILGNVRSGNGSPDIGAFEIISDVVPTENYANWVAGFFLAAGSDGFNDDPDQDGQTNGIEYALGTDPADRLSAQSPVFDLEMKSLTFSRIRRLDVTYVGQGSRDLQTWNLPVTTTSDSATGFSFRMMNPEQMGFLRLSVQRNP